MNRFNSVILDVDSTLSAVEGIDWLASLRGPEMEGAVADLTRRAMHGAIPLESVYGERLNMVRPTAAEVAELGRVYITGIAPDARDVIAELAAEGVEFFIVSGGLREAIAPLAAEAGVKQENIRAVSVAFDRNGDYKGFDEASALTRQNGKRTVVTELVLKGPTLAVGDGMTDSEIRPAVDGFAAYTGFVRRAPVVEHADYEVHGFRELSHLVRG